MSSREGYRVQANSVEDLVRNLNFHLQSIAGRLDKIEGIRGLATMESDLDLTGHRLLNASGTPDQSLDTGDTPSFEGLVIAGGSITITDSNGTIIHQMGS